MSHPPFRVQIGVVAELAPIVFAACSDDADATHPFCRAALAAEAATVTENPTATETASSTAAATAPAELRPAVDTVIAELTAGRAGSLDFTTADGEITDWANAECGFDR